MDTKSIEVEILESTPEKIKVKMPFLDVPIGMNHEFFNKRIKNGYFTILNTSNVPHHLPDRERKYQDAGV